MQQYRWQIIALVFSGIIFILAIGTRITNQPQPTPTVTTTPAETNSSFTETPQTAATEAPATTAPVQNTQSIEPATNTDGISTFTEAVVGNIQRLNPLLAGDNEVEKTVASLIFEGLVKLNEFGEPVPNLAQNWVVSGDGLEYVFTLREDILWQDGLPFSADDVIFTIKLMGSEGFSGDQALNTFWKTVEIEKLSSHRVRFRLTQPLASFTNILTIGIVPEHALRGTSASDLAAHPFNLNPIGTGPYQLEAIRSNNGSKIDAVDLRAAPNYIARSDVESLGIERLRFRMFNTFDEAYTALSNQEVNGLASQNMAQRKQLLTAPGTESYSAIAPEIGVLIFNWDEPDDIRFFQEQRVRWALQRSLDRAPAIYTQLANNAVLAEGPIQPTSWAYLPELVWPGVDMNQAQSLIENISLIRQPASEDDTETSEEQNDNQEESSVLEESGDEESNGTIYQFTILVPENDALVAVANDYAQRWRAINLEVNVESAPQETYQQRLNDGEFDAAIVELPLGADPDVYAYWHVGQAPDGLNYGSVADDRISELLERARRDANGMNRIALYHDFQRLFVERAIAIPLYHPLYTYAVSTNVENVQLGFIGSPADRFLTLRDWQVR